MHGKQVYDKGYLVVQEMTEMGFEQLYREFHVSLMWLRAHMCLHFTLLVLVLKYFT